MVPPAPRELVRPAEVVPPAARRVVAGLRRAAGFAAARLVVVGFAAVERDAVAGLAAAVRLLAGERRGVAAARGRRRLLLERVDARRQRLDVAADALDLVEHARFEPVAELARGVGELARQV